MNNHKTPQYFNEAYGAKETIKQVAQQWHKGKQRIVYRIFIPLSKEKYLLHSFKWAIIVLLLFLSVSIIFIVFSIINADNDIQIKIINQEIIYKSLPNTIKVLSYGFILWFILSLWIHQYEILNIDINRKNKTIIIKVPNERKFTLGKKVKIPFHSTHYLPEFRLPKTEYEKYHALREELQQSITTETGIIFNTKQFYIHYHQQLNLSGSLKMD